MFLVIKSLIFNFPTISSKNNNLFDNVISEADSSTNKSPALNKKISFEIKQYKLNGIKDEDVKKSIKAICKEIGDNLKNDLNSFGTIGKFINDKSNKFKSRIDELNKALEELDYFDSIDNKNNKDDEKPKKKSDEHKSNEKSNNILTEPKTSEKDKTTNSNNEEIKEPISGDITVNNQDQGKYEISKDTNNVNISTK